MLLQKKPYLWQSFEILNLLQWLLQDFKNQAPQQKISNYDKFSLFNSSYISCAKL